MSVEWYYAKADQQRGPVSRDRLIELAMSGEIVPSDLLWNEELADWIPAGELAWLFQAQTKACKVPPPLPRLPENTAPLTMPIEGQEATAFDRDICQSEIENVVDPTLATSGDEQVEGMDQLCVPIEVRTKLKALYGRELTPHEALIAEMFFNVIAGGKNVYTFPSIPEKKLANAKSKYAFLRADELLIGLFDETCFGSAKNGFVLTTSGIHWHEMLEPPSYIRFVDINPTAIQLDGVRITLGNEKQFLPMVFADAETRIALHLSIKNASALSLLMMGHDEPELYAEVQRSLRESLSQGEFENQLVEIIQQVINLPYRKAQQREAATSQTKSVATSQTKSKVLTEQEQSQSNRNWGVYAAACGASVVFPPAGAIVFGGYVAKGLNDKCPSCGKWWGRTKLDTALTEEAIAERFQCKFCNHTWSDQTMVDKIAEATSELATLAATMDVGTAGSVGGGGGGGGGSRDVNSGLVRCKGCGGQGVIRASQDMGTKMREFRCSVCDGKGWVK